MFVRKFVVPALSLVGIGVATLTVIQGSARLAAAPPVAVPATSPFATKIAGAGLVEAASENVSIGTPLPGLVVAVSVKQGQVVQAGDVLFQLDPRQLRAERLVRAAEVESARAELARLAALPRPEDLPPARARQAAAQAALDEARLRLELAEKVDDARAVSLEELTRRRSALASGTALLESAEAELARLAAGAWAPELALARTHVAGAEAALAVVDTELERLSVRAPLAGTVLRIGIRAGEFASSAAREPLLVLGDLTRLHVRVDLDESDAWRFRPGAPAQAFVRGNPTLSTPLEFVRVDPLVIPKRSLTGDPVERVDTRVLQVLYAFEPGALPVYVGQQMDVYIEAPSSEGEAR
jgi:multidrug efflux pump subunit AcrA (membrane-fusion protein)